MQIHIGSCIKLECPFTTTQFSRSLPSRSSPSNTFCTLPDPTPMKLWAAVRQIIMPKNGMLGRLLPTLSVCAYIAACWAFWIVFCTSACWNKSICLLDQLEQKLHQLPNYILFDTL